VQHERNIATLVLAKILAFAFSFLPQGFSTFRTVDHTKPSNEKLTEAIKGIIPKLEICYEGAWRRLFVVCFLHFVMFPALLYLSVMHRRWRIRYTLKQVFLAQAKDGIMLFRKPKRFCDINARMSV